MSEESRPFPQVSDADAAFVSMEEPGNMATDWRASAKYHAVLIKDGGGLSSTLDWQVPPAAGRVRIIFGLPTFLSTFENLFAARLARHAKHI